MKIQKEKDGTLTISGVKPEQLNLLKLGVRSGVNWQAERGRREDNQTAAARAVMLEELADLLEELQLRLK